MQSKKPYTNSTFTKRVDHEGGAHRGRKKLVSPSVCGDCGSIYVDGHWTAKKFVKESEKHQGFHAMNIVVCPACKQIASGVVGGYLSLGGKFLTAHKDEIEHLISNEEEQALESNPLSRVISKRFENGELIIETTTENLAERFGHSIKKAYAGKVDFDFSHENKVARVTWRRD